MANKIWPIFLTITVTMASYAQAGPAKTQTRLYDVYLTAAQMDMTNPDYLGPGAFMRVSRKFRDTPPVLNAAFPFIRDLPTDVNSSWTCYEKTSNRWRESLVKGSLNFCDLLETKIKPYRIFYNYSNFPASCPVKQGNYSITDFHFDTELLPPVILGSEWRVRNRWTSGEEKVLIFTFEFKIDRTKEVRASRKKQPH